MSQDLSAVAQRYLRGSSRDDDDQRVAEETAARLGLPFDDLSAYRGDPELFRQIPVDVMLRYQFVPVERQGDEVVVVMADPSNILAVDEVELAIGAPIEVRVGPSGRISEILEKSESSQRVLDEATEGLAPLIAREIWAIVRGIRASGIATVIVDKNYSAVMKLADRAVILVKGRIAFEGSCAALAAEPSVVQNCLGV